MWNCFTSFKWTENPSEKQWDTDWFKSKKASLNVKYEAAITSPACYLWLNIQTRRWLVLASSVFYIIKNWLDIINPAPWRSGGFCNYTHLVWVSVWTCNSKFWVIFIYIFARVRARFLLTWKIIDSVLNHKYVYGHILCKCVNNISMVTGSLCGCSEVTLQVKLNVIRFFSYKISAFISAEHDMLPCSFLITHTHITSEKYCQMWSSLNRNTFQLTMKLEVV